jgi:hypothetical protein
MRAGNVELADSTLLHISDRSGLCKEVSTLYTSASVIATEHASTRSPAVVLLSPIHLPTIPSLAAYRTNTSTKRKDILSPQLPVSRLPPLLQKQKQKKKQKGKDSKKTESDRRWQMLVFEDEDDPVVDRDNDSDRS